jgi:uncharacterized protein involved in outer membrane biogenesis
MAASRINRRLAWIGIPAALLAILVALWNWDWFIPIVQSRASAALGQPVTMSHLHLRLGRVLQVVADDVVVANPPDWPSGDPPFASIHVLTIQADAWSYLRGNGLVLPLIGVEKPKIVATETSDGSANFRLSSGGGTQLRIGELRIADGDAHVVIPQLKADFNAHIVTRDEGHDARIVVDANGTYAAQPITAHLLGGALLSLRDPDKPWPVDLTIANGPTKVMLNGTLRDPLAFKGADVRLQVSGPDMALLEPLLGVPIPKTTSYQASGKFDLNGFDKIRVEDLRGRVGNSDLTGTAEMQPSGTESKGRSKPVVTLDLRSNRLDLADMSGIIGGTPGRTTTAGATPQQRAAVAKADAGSKLLPDTPISIPRLDWADIHLRYHGAHIEGRNTPLDNVTVTMDLVGGSIKVHPVSFAVGKGQLTANADLSAQSARNVHVRADLHMQNLDVSRMMAATHTFEGAGSISGVGALDATGDSLASLLANGNGQVKMAMAGGDLSAVLVDLTGLHFGNALLSALGMPQKTPVQCFVGDLQLQRGLLVFNTLTLDTGEAITNVGGDLDLSKETIDLALKTDAKHFSVGSLPTRINITGTFKNPTIRPGAEAAARAGATVGLAALFAPLAILPTIQFGTSEAADARCGALLQQAKTTAGAKASPAPLQDAQGPSPAR